MNYIVIDVAATNGGALSVLMDFYKDVALNNINDYWTFIVSCDELIEQPNIQIQKYKWVKKSWAHRILFDYFYLPVIIKKFKPNYIISLQNLTIPFINIPQIVYLHNSLPFVEYRFSIVENSYLWVYQNLIGYLIKLSIKKANLIIVQSKWMLEACKKIENNKAKYLVLKPIIQKDVDGLFELNKITVSTFFYPASNIVFKNHLTILSACKILNAKGIFDYKVIFTINGTEDNYSQNLMKISLENNLPIEFIGTLKRFEVYEYYKKSVLLFPSYIESSPFPLSEAKLFITPILAAKTSFSSEILDEYSNVNYFNPFDAVMLSNLMEKTIKMKIPYDSNVNFVQENIESLYISIKKYTS